MSETSTEDRVPGIGAAVGAPPPLAPALTGAAEVDDATPAIVKPETLGGDQGTHHVSAEMTSALASCKLGAVEESSPVGQDNQNTETVHELKDELPFRMRFLSPSLDCDEKSELLVEEFGPNEFNGWPSMDTPCAALLDLWLDVDLALDDKLNVLEEWIGALAFSGQMWPGVSDAVGSLLQMISNIQKRYQMCTPMSASHADDFMSAIKPDLECIASVVLARFAFDVKTLIRLMSQADLGELTPGQTLAVSLLQTKVVGLQGM
jgi:hypothetical protein